MKKILIIQTAFIGDVILATALLETLHKWSENVEIDILVRKGNQDLLEKHPFLNEVLVWDKKNWKYKNLLRLTKTIRKRQYDYVYNLQRFGATGWLTWRSGAKKRVGFKKNPFSFGFDSKFDHKIGNGEHEIERNFILIKDDLIENVKLEKPKLYPLPRHYDAVADIVKETKEFIVLAPSSVWFTKQLPFQKWCDLINKFERKHTVYLIGAPDDYDYLNSIVHSCADHEVINLAGKLDLLGSAALISSAKRTYVNDSGPLHLASAVNAPVTAFFCSTVPSFGFGPLSDDSKIVQLEKKLDCRPCGLHGHKACPKGHFKCGNLISI
ncbi:MAG: glycosyltransferase family 9 protein [Crocinitomicaceae bacterium]